MTTTATVRPKKRRRRMTKRGKPTRFDGIFSHDNGTYTVRIVVKRKGQRVEKQELFTGTINQAAARQATIRLEVEQQLENQIVSGKGRDTVSALIEYWLDHRRTMGTTTEWTDRRIATSMRLYVVPYFGTWKLDDIKPKDVLDYQAWLTKRLSTRGKPLSTGSLRQIHKDFKIMMKFVCLMTGKPNPATDLSFAAKGGAGRIKVYLNAQQIELAIAAAQREKPKWRALALLLITTGLRFSEATSLTWTDIHTDSVAVVKSQVRRVVRDSTKNGGTRTVPLMDITRKALEDWRAICDKRDDGLIFYAEKGKNHGHLQSSSSDRLFGRLLKHSGLTAKFSPHDLRRSLNNIVRQESGETVAMALLGHVSVDVNRDHYTQVKLPETHRAVSRALFSGGTSGGTHSTEASQVA